MTYKEFESKVNNFEIYRKKRIWVEIFASTFGALLSMTVILSLCYGTLITYYAQIQAASALNIPVISKLWGFILDKSALIKFLPQFPATTIFAILLSIFLPILVSGFFAIILYNFPINSSNDNEDKEMQVSNLEKLSKRLTKSCEYYFIPDSINISINIIFFLIIFSICFYIFRFVSLPLYTTSEKISVALSALIPTLLLFIICIIFKKISIATMSFIWKNRKISQKVNLSQELDNTISRLKKENKEKNEKIKQEKELEEARKKQEKIINDLMEGQKIYEEAISSEPIDEKIMKKAAKLGSPSACYYLGKNLLTDWLSDMYTSEEKEEIAENAANYFDVARQFAELANLDFKTECTFLWLFSRLQYESNNKSEWQEMLTGFRNIQKSGELPEEYTETLESSIKSVVNVIDNLKNKPSTQPTYQPEPEKKFHCIFRNGAICTKESNSVMVYHCNYINNPTACITARENDAIEYR